MANYGKELDTRRIIQTDGFYSTLHDFKGNSQFFVFTPFYLFFCNIVCFTNIIFL